MNVTQLGAACKRWRLEHTDYTQEHFAKIAGVSIAAVSQFERGSRGNESKGSLRIYCAYVSCGMRLPKGSAAEAYADYMIGGGDIGKKRNR